MHRFFHLMVSDINVSSRNIFDVPKQMMVQRGKVRAI